MEIGSMRKGHVIDSSRLTDELRPGKPESGIRSRNIRQASRRGLLHPAPSLKRMQHAAFGRRGDCRSVLPQAGLHARLQARIHGINCPPFTSSTCPVT
jgi:hypothetical protein